jgi:two-component system sensor histidine kinase BarA
VLGRLSLANKCLLLFGAALVLIIVAALAVPWWMMNAGIDRAEVQLARRLAENWVDVARRAAADGLADEASRSADEELLVLRSGLRLFDGVANQSMLRVLDQSQIADVRGRDPFVAQAWAALGERTAGQDPVPADGSFTDVTWRLSVREYRVAIPVRAFRAATVAARDGEPRPLRSAADPGEPVDDDPTVAGLVVLERTSPEAAGQVWANTASGASAGLGALALALLVFYFITSRIILQPVRELRSTAEQVREGNLRIRSEIHTRDEFEDLADAFNEMLGEVQLQQERLRSLNATLDDKVNQLHERNLALYEAAKLKGEFLANVTHELRTPLNSILGFAELLDELVQRDADAMGPAAADDMRINKRRRYVENIISSGRSLLELINGLLEMAKVEAGKMELNVQRLDVRGACENLAALVKPMADKRRVELRVELVGDLPVIYTDPRKLQQIVFNLLSNAIKFTADAAEAEREHAVLRGVEPEALAEVPDGQAHLPAERSAVVTLRADHLIPRSADPAPGEEFVRISVLDTGPGISPEDQKRIFEKFTQLNTGYERKQSGTGLGLAIVRELTTMLQGEVQVHSEVGRGSMFSVILPVRLDPTRGLVGARVDAAADPGAASTLGAAGSS